MNRVFIFPGQGSQKIGMCKDLYENFAVAKEVFAEVDDALSFKLSDIIFGGTDEELTRTCNTQPALMAASMSLIKVIEHLSGKKIKDICSLVAGHSLGQYTALCASGALSISDCALILRSRGLFMQDACPKGEGGMAAILGADLNVVKSILVEASRLGVCEIANDNSKEQIVISGNNIAIDKAIILFKENGVKAIKLNVSAPFHCSLMNPALERMKDVIQNARFNPLSIPVIDNVSIKITDDVDFLKQKLIEQIVSTVRWRETMDIIAEKYTAIYEIGEGKILTNLFNRSHSSVSACAINNKEDIANIIPHF